MISISSATYSTDHPVVINRTEKCRLGEQVARVKRSATLDGGAVISHFGVSAGDRTLLIDARVTAAQATRFKTLFSNGVNGVMVGISDGVFFGTVSELDLHSARLKATILIESKESA